MAFIDITDIDLKCPWNNFQDCFKYQCPFYGAVYIEILDDEQHEIRSCMRAKKILNETELL